MMFVIFIYLPDLLGESDEMMYVLEDALSTGMSCTGTSYYFCNTSQSLFMVQPEKQFDGLENNI